jgi:hypothetical protein
MAARIVEHLYRFYEAHLKHNVEEALDVGRDTCSQFATIIFQFYDEHLKHDVDQLLDAGKASCTEHATPLFSEIDREWKVVSTEMHSAVSSLVERVSIHFAEICPRLFLLLDTVENHADQRLVQGARIYLKSLCLDPGRTSVSFLKLLGVFLGVICVILLRRYLLATLRTLIRVLLWPVQVVTSVALAPLLFFFRSSLFLHRRLFVRCAREEEVHQPDFNDEQSCKIMEEDQKETEVHRPESCDEQSCELTEEDQDEERGHQADFREEKQFKLTAEDEEQCQ